MLLFKVVLLGVAVSLGFAQNFVGGQSPFTKDRLKGLPESAVSSGSSLLDPARFSMNQSYSMSYASMGGQGDLTGLYLNRLQYQFQAPVTLQVDLGYFHKPMMSGKSGLASPNGAAPSAFTVPHVGLTYQPAKNMVMSFEYFHLPAGYGNALSPYGYNPFSRYPLLNPLDGASAAPSK